MATEKKINSRIQQKHDVAANWAKATNFIPKKGEIIIYDAEYNASGEETQAVRFKIGDGSKTVNNLPFAVIDYSSDIGTLKQKVANNSTAIGALQENTVPKTRKINNKALSSDITLGAADVGVNETTFPGLKKTGTVTGVKMNGTTKNPSSGVVDLGTVIAAHQSIKSINTNNTAAQIANVSEAIAGSGTINLHKIAKTGSYSDLLNKPSFADIPNRGEAFLTWGGQNFASSYGPIDAAMVPALGANRLAFVPAAGIKVEYSRDNGTTWSDYELNDSQKTAIFSGPQVSTTAVIGKPGSKNPSTNKYDNASVNNRLRITILTNFASVYTQLNKFVIYCSTSGSDGCKCTIDGRTKANYDANSSTWTTFADGVTISGWSGFNVINTPSITTYGNTSNQYVELRFTFYCTSAGSMATYGGLQISNIYGFGGVGWTTPSTMAKWGQVYTYDASQNVTFPAAVKANTLYENGTTLSSKYQAKGNYVNKTEVVQATGTSTTSIMSQKATTDELAKKAKIVGGNTFENTQYFSGYSADVNYDYSIIDCFFGDGDNSATIFGVKHNSDANDSGRVLIGADDGTNNSVEIQLNGNTGAAGQVLTSQGAGKTPQWSTPPTFSFSNGVLRIIT